MARLQLLQVASLWRHVESLSFGAGVKTLRSPCSSLPSSWSSSMQNPFQCLGVSFSTLQQQQQQQQRVMMMTTMTFASHNHPNFLPLALASRGLRPQEQLLVGCLPVINYGQSNSWLTSQGLKFFFSSTTTLPADASSRQEEGGVVEVEKEKSSSTGGGAEINTAAAHNKKGMMDGAPKYSVVRINSDGSWLSLSLTSAQLGIHPRDIDVLAGGKSFVPQRATIAVRNNKVVLRMENVRALVCKDFVLLFEARKPRISKRGVFGRGTSSLGKAPEEVMKK
jgi:hypothetical protein